MGDVCFEARQDHYPFMDVFAEGQQDVRWESAGLPEDFAPITLRWLTPNNPSSSPWMLLSTLLVVLYSVGEIVVRSVFYPTAGGTSPTFSTASGQIHTAQKPPYFTFPEHIGKKALVTNHLQWPVGGKVLALLNAKVNICGQESCAPNSPVAAFDWFYFQIFSGISRE